MASVRGQCQTETGCKAEGMDDSAEKVTLLRNLSTGREALIWKLDGLSECDVRRPMVPTGTNLLGLIKHVASLEAGYLGRFRRPASR